MASEILKKKQQRIFEIERYLRYREKLYHDLMNELSKDTEMYKEVRAKHVELLYIMKELNIKISQ